MPAPLKPRHLDFIKAYSALGKPSYRNGAESARLCGYTHRNASSVAQKLLKDKRISAELSQIFANQDLEIRQETSATREELTKISKGFLKECGAKHSNTPKYIEILAKLNSLYNDGNNVQTLIYNASQNEDDNVTAKKMGNLIANFRKNKLNSTNESQT